MRLPPPAFAISLMVNSNVSIHAHMSDTFGNQLFDEEVYQLPLSTAIPNFIQRRYAAFKLCQYHRPTGEYFHVAVGDDGAVSGNACRHGSFNGAINQDVIA